MQTSIALPGGGRYPSGGTQHVWKPQGVISASGDDDRAAGTHAASAHVASVDEDGHSIPLPRAAVAPRSRAAGKRRQPVQESQYLRTHAPSHMPGAAGQGLRDLTGSLCQMSREVVLHVSWFLSSFW